METTNDETHLEKRIKELKAELEVTGDAAKRAWIENQLSCLYYLQNDEGALIEVVWGDEEAL